MWGPAGVNVRAYHKDASLGGPDHEDASVQVAVCTFEKANALLNAMLSTERGAELGIVVIDELHMLADPHRGALLELFVTKLRYLPQQPQLVGLSATLPNLGVLSAWLDASLYLTDFRPVPLRQFHVIGSDVFDGERRVERRLPPRPPRGATDDWAVCCLCKEAVDNSHSVLGTAHTSAPAPSPRLQCSVAPRRAASGWRRRWRASCPPQAARTWRRAPSCSRRCGARAAPTPRCKRRCPRAWRTTTRASPPRSAPCSRAASGPGCCAC